MKQREPIVEHGRVRLRSLELADAPRISEYRSDPDVARLQSWETCTLVAAETLCRAMQEVAIGTPGTWFQMAIVLAETGEMIGDCGLRFPGPDESGHGTEIEIGITLAREHQGKGLASDALGAITDLAFTRLGKRALRASVDALNTPAAALLTRAGFARSSEQPRRAMFKGAWCEEHDYILRANERVNGAG